MHQIINQCDPPLVCSEVVWVCRVLKWSPNTPCEGLGLPALRPEPTRYREVAVKHDQRSWCSIRATVSMCAGNCYHVAWQSCVLTSELTNFLEESSYSKPVSHSASKSFSAFCGTVKFYFRVHSSIPLNPLLSQINLAQNLNLILFRRLRLQSSYSKPVNHSASKSLSAFCGTAKVYFRVHSSIPLNPLLSQINLAQNLNLILFLRLRLGFPRVSFSSSFRLSLYAVLIAHACYIPN
jgi:hypothetical protein